MPAEFVVQSLDAANPPTLFLVLADMARSLPPEGTPQGEAAEDLQFLQAGAAASTRLKAVSARFLVLADIARSLPEGTLPGEAAGDLQYLQAGMFGL